MSIPNKISDNLHWDTEIHKTLNPQIWDDNFLTNYTRVDFNLYQSMVMLGWLEGIGPSCVTEKKFLLTTKGSGLFVLVWGKNVRDRCQWSTKHDLAVVQQNGREGKKNDQSLYVCVCRVMTICLQCLMYMLWLSISILLYT